MRDIHICEPKQGAQLAANYEKFLWEVGMAQKFPWWKEDASLQKIQNAYDEMMRYFGYSMKIKNIMKTEYGLCLLYTSIRYHFPLSAAPLNGK